MKLSILVITYNHEKYIVDAIKSVVMQKFNGELEIVVVDDASTDNTIDLLHNELQNISNVHVYKNEINIGITKNYQKGFSLCKGEYVAVLEGDDYWIDPYKLKKQVNFLEENPFCAMCFHPFIIQQGDLPDFENNFKNSNATYSDLFSIRDIILNEGLIANFSVCTYKKSSLERLPQELFEVTSYDWMVNISIAQFGFLGRINTPMSVYRWAPSGTWASKSLRDRLTATLELLPTYDKILNYRFSHLFSLKSKILKEQIQLSEISGWESIKSFLPPFLISITKAMVPSVFFKSPRN